jgi:hypothetical protein
MTPLAYGTSKISWQLLNSAMLRVQASPGDIEPIDLNLEALSTIVLSCTALEAFVNEASSLAHAFLFGLEKDNKTRHLETDKWVNVIGLSLNQCTELAKIKDNDEGSFYDRYKLLVKTLIVTSPPFLQSLCHLKNIRDSVVHFRITDIPLIEDSHGVIRYEQPSPEVFQHLKQYTVEGWPIIATDGKDGSSPWNLRISTTAMAVWCLGLVLDAILYSIDAIPNGEFRNFVHHAYRRRDESSVSVFQKGRSELDSWAVNLFRKR